MLPVMALLSEPMLPLLKGTGLGVMGTGDVMCPGIGVSADLTAPGTGVAGDAMGPRVGVTGDLFDSCIIVQKHSHHLI